MATEEQDTCVICLEVPQGESMKMTLSCACKLAFCVSCILSWLQQSKNACPTCRKKVQVLEKSNKLCKDAYMNIANAEAEGFHNKESLKMAMRQFISAAHADREAVEPCILTIPLCAFPVILQDIGLAYLSLLIDIKPLAVKYLNEALRLKPANVDALRLMEYVKLHENDPPEQDNK